MAVTTIYSSDNYVIIRDAINTYEYAKGWTTYTLKNSIFTIKETVGGEYNVTIADINAGNIKNESNVAYTIGTFTTFLRQNTGFKTAAGGSAAAPIGALLQKSGQTTSYRTGDDGDIEAGRATSFAVLSANNPFGNTNRFTDELGGQTYTKNIVIDWSTYNGTDVLGWYRVVSGNVDWNTAIDGALAISITGFTSGWRLPNTNEFGSIMNWGLTSALNYSPFNLGGYALQTSTTWGFTTTNNITIGATGFYGISAKLGASGRYIGVRNFTVTGTTLS